MHQFISFDALYCFLHDIYKQNIRIENYACMYTFYAVERDNCLIASFLRHSFCVGFHKILPMCRRFWIIGCLFYRKNYWISRYNPLHDMSNFSCCFFTYIIHVHVYRCVIAKHNYRTIYHYIVCITQGTAYYFSFLAHVHAFTLYFIIESKTISLFRIFARLSPLLP